MDIPISFGLPLAGYGFIGGDPAAAGGVTHNDAPGVDRVDLFVRSTGALVRTTYSNAAGAFRFPALLEGVEYDVIGRNESREWQDVIVGAVLPKPYVEP